MRRLWGSLAVLALLVSLMLWNIRAVGEASAGLSETLRQAQDLAEAGDWSAAEKQTEQAFSQWQEQRLWLSIVLRMDDTSQVDSSFYEARALVRDKELKEYLPASRELVQHVEQLGEWERPSWENVL